MDFSLGKDQRRKIDELLRCNISGKIQKRLLALLWLDDGKPIDEVADLLARDRALRARLAAHLPQQGLRRSARLALQGRCRRPDPQPNRPNSRRKLPPAGSTALARSKNTCWILFSAITRSAAPNACSHRIGCSFHQVSGFLFKADRDKQEAFVQQLPRQSPNRIKKNDAISSTLVIRSGVWKPSSRCWLLRGQRLDLGVGGGRKRFNILGAYCPQDQEYIDVRQAGGTISYAQVVELLEKLHGKASRTRKFVLHLDNARYQHARKLKEWIAQQQTEGITFVLDHVPPYSPNLNLIERLWKFLRKACASNLARHLRSDADGHRQSPRQPGRLRRRTAIAHDGKIPHSPRRLS